MKKMLCLLLLAVIAGLSGCATESIHDSFSAYQNKTAAQLYQSALLDLKKDHSDRAVKKLEAQSALYPFGAYAEEGVITLVYAYYEDDDNDEALATVDRYLRLYPTGKYADYALYMRGVIAFKRGLTWLQKKVGVSPAPRDFTHLQHAFIALSELTQEFPKSPYLEDSLIRMRYIRNMAAQKELNNADFYYQRGAYVAAANRASDVVQHFDGAPAVIPALAIMVKSYRRLGLNQLADDTLAILHASYPHSPKLKSLY